MKISKRDKKKTILTQKASGIVIEYRYLGLDKHWKGTIKTIRNIVSKMVMSGTQYAKAIEKVKYTANFEV